MTRARPYDWLALKTEYVLGDLESVAGFFQEIHPEITSDTYEKKTKGWREERRLYAAKTHALALQKSATKRSDMLARQIDTGQRLQFHGLESMVGKDGKPLEGMKPQNSDQAVRMIKAGADIEREAVLAEDLPVGITPEELAVGVEISAADLEHIRIFAKAYGRRKALGGTR